MNPIELDNKIGSALSLSYKTIYMIMNKEETSFYIDFSTLPEAEDWLKKNVYPDGTHIVNWKEYPPFSRSLDAAKIVADELNRRGAYLKLVSPFLPYDPPMNESRREQWEKTKNHWWASFDYQGTSNNNLIWQASSKNPAEAIVLAALEFVKDELPF